MTDFENHRKRFRRKRAFQGGTWTPPSVSAHLEDGVWCPVHRKHHGYKTMILRYGEKNSEGKTKLLWCCPLTGNVLEEM